MPHWYDPLLTFLAAQPAETASVTLTLAEVETLVNREVPPIALTRGYWWDHGPRSMGEHLAAGWRVAHVRGRPVIITFARLPPEAPAGQR